MPMEWLFLPIGCTVSCKLLLVADKLCSLNTGTHSIMHQELACISNAFYARSHLFSLWTLSTWAPLILSICWAIKARPPYHLGRDDGKRLAVWVAYEENAHSLEGGCLHVRWEAEQEKRESARWSRKGLLIIFSTYRGQGTRSIKYWIIATDLDLFWL